MRLPVVPSISTKDGVSNKNARLTNCLKEVKKSGDMAVIRPGLVTKVEGTGVGGGLVAFNNELVSVYGATLGIGITPSEFDPWTENAMPSSESWLSIAWNGTVFCALGGGASATSPDGITWTPGVGLGPGVGSWCAPAWNGSVFCSVKDFSSSVATSTDGLTWSVTAMPVSHNWVSIAWNGSLFCAVAYDGTAYATSPDGVAWTMRTLPASMTAPFAIVWNGSVFCVTMVHKATTSVDGITWTLVTAMVGGGTSLAWNGVTFCSCRGATNAADFSSDGVTWTTGTLPGIVFGGTANITAVGRAFVVFGGAGDVAYISEDDGVSWTSTTAMPNTDGGTFYGISGSSDRAVVVVESSGYSVTMINQNASIPALDSIPEGYYDFVQSPL